MWWRGIVFVSINHIKNRATELDDFGWLIMHHVVALIAERQGSTCTNWLLS
ncbi:hypothetical protein Hanom_Chr15g01395681 [Helianthus anomalus]